VIFDIGQLASAKPARFVYPGEVSLSGGLMRLLFIVIVVVGPDRLASMVAFVLR
jgi:hypothetical protein